MLYLLGNGAMPTTAAFVKVTTGTAIKTMMQLKATNVYRIVEWGISFDGSAAATPGQVELIDTGTVFATVTAYGASGVDAARLSGRDQATADVAGVTAGTSASGYTATAEGSITATNVLDMQLLPPTAPYVKQFPLGAQPLCVIGNSTRIRVTFGAAISAYCYMIIDI